MAMINPDMSEVLESLPNGEYKAHIVGDEFKTSQAGNDYVRWKLSVFDAADPRCNGKFVSYMTMLKGSSAWKISSLYKAATGKPFAGQFDTQELIGKAVLITVTEGTKKNDLGETVASGYPEVLKLQPLN